MNSVLTTQPTIDDKAVQQVLVQLAAAAADTRLTTQGVDLPDTWKMLTSKSVFALSVGNVQFLLAYGNVGKDVIACLAVGLPWQNFLGAYSNGFQKDSMQQLPEYVVGATTSKQTVMTMFVTAYQFLRKPIWDALPYLNNDGVKGKRLYVTGMGLGSALAQVVAIDFRENNKGPNEQLPPEEAQQPPSFVFSAGNFASTEFQQFYTSPLVTDAYNTTAGSAALPVDQFPDAPSTSLSFAPLGKENQVSASVPTPYYTPWEVRDSNFYVKTLGGTPIASLPSKTDIPHPPAGFSQALAFSLGKYTELTYVQALQPGTPAPVNMKKLFDYGAHPALAAIFSTANSLIVAFRGSITFEEFLMMDASSTRSITPADQQITTGTYDILYQPPSEGVSALVDQIKEQIKDLKGDLKLYITGHSFGGALANVLAMDLALDTGLGITADAIYTLGASYFAGANAADTFNNHLSTVSYQVVRPQDGIATALRAYQYWFPVDNTVILNGALDTREDTHHALSSYLKLLDPSRVQPS